MISPALLDAGSDQRLSHHERSLLFFIYTCGWLDYTEYRPLKVAAVCAGARLRKATAIAALRHLREIGYLRTGADDPGAPREARGRAPRCYRLVWSLPARPGAGEFRSGPTEDAAA